MIAPPSLYLLLAREHLSAGIEVAAQNVFDKPNGAFTGEISAEQLKDSGIGWALAGHSERRVILGEDNAVSDDNDLTRRYIQFCITGKLKKKKQQVTGATELTQFCAAPRLISVSWE